MARGWADSLLRRAVHPHTAAFRWSIMVLASLMIFGAYYAYDSIGSVAVDLKEDLGWSSTQVGLLYSAYHVPNTIAPFLGGLFVDRVGKSIATLVFNGLVVVGSILVASSSWFALMVFGRFLFGLGAENLVVVQSSLVGEWFAGKEMALSMGLCLTFARLALFASLFSLPRLSNISYSLALWVSAFVCVASFVTALVMAALDLWGRRVLAEEAQEGEVISAVPRASGGGAGARGDLAGEVAVEPTRSDVEGPLVEEEATPGVARGGKDEVDTDTTAVALSPLLEFWQKLRQYSMAMWIVAAVSLTFYPSVQPFASFGVDFLTSDYGYDKARAGDIISMISFTTMFLTPAFGHLLDRYGHMSLCMATGAALLSACLLILAATTFNPIPMILGVGVAYSMVPAAIWPAVPRVVPEAEHQATAFGITTAAYNVGLFVFPVVVGYLQDTTGSYAWSDVALASLSAVCCLLSISLSFTSYSRVLSLPSARTTTAVAS
eukprot:TRINITY_DN15941_c0_g1_i1.p1 TRINITY_DN15941_c0_g1~~TRINITY_DN15941_c0_g1_i1.p1  ORF type:complete len:492 (-),score=85.07 TRINITY_DN15941_c0_g1_i1:348-1823(-)